MNRLLLSLSFLAFTTAVFSQTSEAGMNSQADKNKIGQIESTTQKPINLLLAIKANPISILSPDHLWYQFNIEANIPKVPRTSIIISFGKNISTGINFTDENIYNPNNSISIPSYIYSSVTYFGFTEKGIASTKRGYTNEIGLRHYIPLHKNALEIEGLSLGVFYSVNNSRLLIKEQYLNPSSVGRQTYLNGGTIIIEKFQTFYGAEIGYQKVFGKQKQFIFNIDAGYGKKTISYTTNSSSIVGPGISQKFSGDNTFGLKGNIAIGVLLH